MKCFSIVYQHDSMLCGVACLKMICKYFGREYSSDSLSKLCFATTEGVSMLGINETAKTLGIETVCAKATPKELCETPLPCILHWNQNHFVVLYKVKKGKKFYVADPGKGKTTYNLEDFKQHWISTRSNGEDKYNPQNEMFNNRKTKRYIFKTKRIFFVSPSIMQIM